MRSRDSILWKISGKGRFDAYVLGSIHIPLEHSVRSLDTLDRCMRESDLFFAETDLDVVPDLQANSDWSADLSDKLQKKWSKLLEEKYQIDLRGFTNLPPLILYNLITVKDLGFSEGMPMDHELWLRAKSQGLMTRGLVQVSEHYKILKDISISDQLIWLKKYLNRRSINRSKMRALFQLYNQERVHQIYTRTNKSLGKYRKLMLTDRNHVMASQIVEHMKENRLFAVMGAAHLSGQNGVLHGLNKHDEISIKPMHEI